MEKFRDVYNPSVRPICRWLGRGWLRPFTNRFCDGDLLFPADPAQQKRAKQHKEMLSAIRRGDKIVTSGGLTGTIVKVVEDSETVEIEIAKDVKVHVVRAMIADVKGKPEPAK